MCLCGDIIQAFAIARIPHICHEIEDYFQPDHFFQECCLCSLRGGALKPTSDGNWAHIICALTIREVKFEDIQRP